MTHKEETKFSGYKPDKTECCSREIYFLKELRRIQTGLDFCGQDVPVVGCGEPATSCKSHHWHLTIQSHDAEYHHRGQVLGCGHVVDFRDVLHKAGHMVILLVND
ncbi:Hypothetical predicted protein [Octopus vulgaris]|uniref:Uncharacterized protein n=1 Tax=Octopus vulgaris TaxID=6645 RepID=A0AA36B574_OCTVU|nr:Hypothetical predicted protein [Octopus vulgaris]